MYVEQGISFKRALLTTDGARCNKQLEQQFLSISIFRRRGQEAVKSHEAPLGTAVAPDPQNPDAAFTTTGCQKLKTMLGRTLITQRGHDVIHVQIPLSLIHI